MHVQASSKPLQLYCKRFTVVHQTFMENEVKSILQLELQSQEGHHRIIIYVAGRNLIDVVFIFSLY